MWSNCSFQASYCRNVGVFFPDAVHSLVDPAQACVHKQAALCVPAGQYWDAFMVSQEYLSGSEDKPHLFLCSAWVFTLSARHCECVPETQAPSLIPCQMKGYSNSHPCLTLQY